MVAGSIIIQVGCPFVLLIRIVSYNQGSDCPTHCVVDSGHDKHKMDAVAPDNSAATLLTSSVKQISVAHCSFTAAPPNRTEIGLRNKTLSL